MFRWPTDNGLFSGQRKLCPCLALFCHDVLVVACLFFPLQCPVPVYSFVPYVKKKSATLLNRKRIQVEGFRHLCLPRSTARGVGQTRVRTRPSCLVFLWSTCNVQCEAAIIGRVVKYRNQPYSISDTRPSFGQNGIFCVVLWFILQDAGAINIKKLEVAKNS